MRTQCLLAKLYCNNISRNMATKRCMGWGGRLGEGGRGKGVKGVGDGKSKGVEVCRGEG